LQLYKIKITDNIEIDPLFQLLLLRGRQIGNMIVFMLKAQIPLLYQSDLGFGAIAFNVFFKQINTYRFFHEKKIIPVYK
jgi:hypothetical protein